MSAYYNDVDPFVCEWVRNLIKAGLICDGEVDCRPIQSVAADDLRRFAQVHMFCGIAIWSYALRLAGWPDDRPVWTGSSPCQPFSAAGKGQADEDDRHLAPAWLRLIGERRPPVVFGEQVGAAVRVGWLDALFTEMESMHYACGAVDFPACSVGAPHIRQRLYFVADRDGSRCGQRRSGETGDARGSARLEFAGLRAAGDLADSKHAKRWPEHGPLKDERDRDDDGRAQAYSGLGACREVRSVADAAEPRRPGEGEHERGPSPLPARSAEHGDVGDAEQSGLQEQRGERGTSREEAGADTREAAERTSPSGSALAHAERHGGRSDEQEWEAQGRALDGRPSPCNGFWRDAEWIACIDGKARPVEPGTFPLAHGIAGRVGRLRAYGNCIVAPQAAEFIRAYMSLMP